jgi:hypothetical protein
VVIDHFGGSAPLGILVVAVLLGNASSLSKRLGLADVLELDARVRGFHRQMAFIIKSFFFVFIGAMLGPPWSLTAFGALLGVLLFGARLPSVWLSTVGGDFSRAERQMVSIALPRGMTAGVLAILPVEKGIVGARSLPLVVFSSILVTILIFAVGFPLVRRKMPTVAASEASLPASEVQSVSPLATAPTRYSPAPGSEEPVGQPAPAAPAKPVGQPAPAAPAKPVGQPAPAAPAKPVGQPAPAAPAKPDIQSEHDGADPNTHRAPR